MSKPRSMPNDASTQSFQRKLQHSLMAVSLSFSLIGATSSPAKALDSDDVGFYGSVTVQRAAQAAASARFPGVNRTGIVRGPEMKFDGSHSG